MAETKYGDISPRTAGYAVRKLLERGQHNMIIERFGMYDPQPKKSTDSRKWRRYESLARAIAPLAEGVTPAGSQLTYTDYVATLEYYGDWVKITDRVADMHEDPVLNQASDLCSEQFAETMEVIRFNTLKGGTNVYYTGTVSTRGTVTTAVKLGDIRRVVRGLRRNKCKEITTIIKASANVGTEAIAPAYIALAHTDLESDIRNIEGFVSVEQYSNSDKALPFEIGKVEGVRFILSALYEPWLAVGASGTTNLSSGSIPATSLACDVYPILVFGRDAYGIVPLQGMDAANVSVVNPKPVVGDPLAQQGFVSWKTAQACAILNQNWIARLEAPCTARP